MKIEINNFKLKFDQSIKTDVVEIYLDEYTEHEKEEIDRIIELAKELYELNVKSIFVMKD